MESGKKIDGRFAIERENTFQGLSEEWIDLVREAMESNVTKEEFREFIGREQKERLLRETH